MSLGFMVENVIWINSGITINVGASAKNNMYVKKNYIWNPVTCSCGNDKYLAILLMIQWLHMTKLLKKQE